MRKILVTSTILINVIFSQNDGFVVTKYPSGAIHTEGNYNNGVRNGLWTIWYEGEVYQDFGADGEPNTQDEGENNNKWDSTETVILDLDGDTFFDPPQKKEEGSYIEGNFVFSPLENSSDGNRILSLGPFNDGVQIIQSIKFISKLTDGNWDQLSNGQLPFYDIYIDFAPQQNDPYVFFILPSIGSTYQPLAIFVSTSS